MRRSILGLVIALAGPWAGCEAATVPATQVTSAPTEGVRAPVRVVPQLWCQTHGLPDPTGRFAVARTSPLLSGLRIVDLKRERLAWIVEPSPSDRSANFAFSNDGRMLAISSFGGGELLSLPADQVTAAPWLKGGAPAFSPDDKLIYVAASAKDASNRFDIAYVSEVEVYEWTGKKVKSYPLQMNMVGHIGFSKDRQTLIVDGGMGVRLESRAGGTFTPLRETINLSTGESRSIESPVARKDSGFGDFDAMNFQTVPTPAVTLNQDFTGTVWDASTHSLAVAARGQPEGGALKLWDLKAGKFEVTVGTRNSVFNASLLAPGLLVGTAWHDKESLPPELAALPMPPLRNGITAPAELVTLVQLPEGTTRPLSISARDWTQCKPSPDGRHLAGLIGQGVQGFTYRVQIWDTKQSLLVGEIVNPKQPIYHFQWTSDGRFLIVMLEGQDRKKRWEFYTPKGVSDGIVPEVSNWAVSFSPSGDLMAVENAHRTSVLKSRTGEWVATFATAIFTEALFLDEERLLIAGKGADEPIRLFRIGDQKVLWEVKATDEIRRVSWDPEWEAVVVHYGANASADVLSIKDGRRLPGGEDKRPGWCNPTLLHGGRLALDPLCNSSILRLKETATGRTVATFAAFADPEWIVYTPDGLWTGSPRALDWVAFYRGTESLTPDEIAALRQPEVVQARLAAGFR